MVWTYSKDPASSPKDAARFLLGDVIEEDKQLNDEELLYLLDNEGSDPVRAAARGAEELAARYARKSNKSLGSLSLQQEGLSQKYQQLAAALWSRVSSTATGVSAGGLTTAEKELAAADTTSVQPFFTRDMMSYKTSLNSQTDD